MHKQNASLLSYVFQAALVLAAGAVSVVGLQRVISGMNQIADVSSPMLAAVKDVQADSLKVALESSHIMLRSMALTDPVGADADALRASMASEMQEFESAITSTYGNLSRYQDLSIDLQEEQFAQQIRQRLDDIFGRHRELIETAREGPGSVQRAIALDDESEALEESMTSLFDRMTSKEQDETNESTTFARETAVWATNVSALAWLLAVVGTVMLGWKAWRRVNDLENAQDQQRILIKQIETKNAELSQMGAELLASETRYRDLVERSLDPVWRMAEDGTFTYISPTIKEVSGFDAKEVIGRKFDDLRGKILEESSATKARKMLDQRLAGGVGIGEQVYELTCLRKDGGQYVAEVRSQPILSEGGEVVEIQGVMRDITERKSAEARRIELERQLQQSQKLEAVGKLAGGIAHDFNNILTAINGYGDLLLDDMQPDDPLHHGLSEIRRAGERATKLTRQILAFSRKQVLQPEVVDIGEVVVGMEDMVRRIIGEAIDFEVHCDANLHKTKADPGQVEQVVLNLVVNAREAMPSGGRLRVCVKDVVLAPDHNLLGDVSAGRYVMIEVADTGVGVDEASIAHIFEPFFTTKDADASGLGLSTVFGIVTQSGGGVGVDSVPGEGSTFRVYLPMVEATATASAEPAVPAPVTGHETILVVEDEQVIRGLLKRSLENAGYSVLLAGNGAEALRVVREHVGKIDLVVTDVVMPVMGGRDLAAQMAILRPETKVLYMSGYDEKAAEPETATGQVLAKPFGIHDLAMRIRELLDGPTGAQPSLG